MSLINLIVAARNNVAEWRRRARAYDELMALDDRSLADIGIHRSQIPALVEGVENPRPPVEAEPTRPVFNPARLATTARWFPPF